MNARNFLTTFPAIIRASRLSLPYSIDFSTWVNGTVPTPFDGATWTIASGKAINTPTPGADLMQSGYGTYASGVGGWVAYGTNTVENDTGAVKISYVNHGNGAHLDLRASVCLTSNLTVGTFYQLTFDVKVDTGNNVDAQLYDGSKTFSIGLITNTTFVTKQFIFQTRSATACYLQLASMAAGEIVWIDNVTVKPLTTAELFSTFASVTQPTQFVIRTPLTRATIQEEKPFGIVANLDSRFNPQNYVICYRMRAWVFLVKVVAGTATVVTSISTGATFVDHAALELRKNGTTYQIYYNDAQIGTDQTISDAGIINNHFHGMINASNQTMIESIFMGTSLTALSFVALGGSITDGADASDYDLGNYGYLTYKKLSVHYPGYSPTFTNSGVGSTGSWYCLVRLQTDVIDYTPMIVSLDCVVNDLNTALTPRTCEALVRRIRTALPNAKLVCNIFMFIYDRTGVDTTNRDEAQAQIWRDLAAYYGFAVSDWAAEVARAVAAAEHTLADYFFDDTVHPGDFGHQEASRLLDAIIDPPFLSTTQWNGTLPARLYDSADYEVTPIIRTGADNDGETGAGWSSVSTGRQSATANDTISWAGTFSSFGLETNYGVSAGTVAWSVDGGAFTNVDLSTRTHSNANVLTGSFSRAAHTITLKVISGTVLIVRFMAI